MDNYREIIKKIEQSDECNKEIGGNFGRTMTITMADAFLCKQLLEEKVVNENCNLQNVMASAPKMTVCENCINYRIKGDCKTVGICNLDDETTWNSAKCGRFKHLP